MEKLGFFLIEKVFDWLKRKNYFQNVKKIQLYYSFTFINLADDFY